MSIQAGELSPLFRPGRAGYQAVDKRTFGNSHEAEAGFFSRVTWWWLNGLIRFGYQQPLEMDDLAPLSECDQASTLLTTFDRHWDEELRRPRASFIRATRKTVGFYMYVAGVCKLAGDLLGFVGPVLLHTIVAYVGDVCDGTREGDFRYGALLVVGMFSASMLQTLSLHQHHHLVIREAVHARTLGTAAVYRKLLELSPHGVQTVSSGKIVNLVSSDSQRLQDVLFFVHYLWAAPLQIVVALFLAVHYLGYSALVGFGLMVVVLPLQNLLNGLMRGFTAKALACTDKRVGLITEILMSIRNIKFYAWEDSFKRELTAVRNAELTSMLHRSLAMAGNSLLLQSGPVLVSLASFTVYAYTSPDPLTAAKCFTALSLFNILRLPLSVLPTVISLSVQARVSAGRLGDFLQLQHVAASTQVGKSDLDATEPVLELRHASFARESSGAGLGLEVVLRDVSLAVRPGELTVVVGTVGSGKSTLVQAALGEVPCASGGAFIRGSVALVTQEAWILHETVRENILMGAPLDEARYRAVLRACALERDLEILVDGDMTVVGESGLNLSGGQKMRVAIARAAYSGADLFVFDSPLAALDAEVAGSVFDQCMCGLLAGKARLLVTNNLDLAAAADTVVVMDQMAVAESGPFAELQAADGLLASMMREGGFDGSVRRSVAGSDYSGSGSDDELKGVAAADAKRGKDVVDEEAREVGAVRSDVYMAYLRLCGVGGCLFVLLLTLAQQTATSGADVWLSVWTSHSDEADQTIFYLKIYAALSLGSVAVIAVNQVVAAVVGLRGARAAHARFLDSVLGAPVAFFDSTPVGRITNRMAADTGIVDSQLSASFSGYVGNLVSLAGSCVVQLLAAWYMAFAATIVLFLYQKLGAFYRRTSRELKRLDSVSKSPVFVHFNQTLNGLPSLRAYGLGPRFLDDMFRRIDTNNRAFWLSNLCNRWLGVRLEFLGNVMLLTTGLAVVAANGAVSVGIAGLVLSYALNMTGTLNWTVRASITTETQLNAIERVLEFSALEPEGSSRVASVSPPRGWPTRGAIEFRGVSARYRPDLPLVARDLTFTVAAGEKVGICGRTGAGKSTIMLLLLRVLEATTGKITIDGVDTAKMELARLRRGMCIIPQLPVLFSGSIRFNLDPFNDYSDGMLFAALERVGLRSAVESLDDEVVEGGENFSVGERQLFCLARAVVRGAKILLLDEATSSVDAGTDARVQRIFRTEFTHATVLTIAHRISTILDNDRVLVLDDGAVLEYDSPAQLKAAGGVFASLCRESGLL